MWHRLFLAQRLFVYHLTDLLKLLSRTEERSSAADISDWEPGLDLRSSLSFTAKRRSALPQEVPNKGREMETHRNKSLCSHDLIRHGGARLSGSSAACCTNGIIWLKAARLQGQSENYAALPRSCSAIRAHRFGTEEESRCPHDLVLELNIKTLVSAFPQTVMRSPLQCLNMVFLLSKYGHLRHGRSI